MLADFQMRHLDLFYAKGSGDPSAQMGRMQENEQRRDDALRSLLGVDAYDRYRHYQLELPERQYVAWFSRGLDPADALSSAQQSQLMAIVAAQSERADSQRQARLLQRLREVAPARTSAELQEANIRASEDGLREMEAQSRRLLQQASSCLTAPQLATLTQLENRKVDAQRRWVAGLRTNSGSMGPLIPGQGIVISSQDDEGPDTSESPR
jgi:hypothetical protein